MRLTVLALTICLLPACALLETTDGEVSIRSEGSGLFITNRTNDRIYYFVVGQTTETLIDWGPHRNLEASIARNESARVSYDEILRSEDEDDIIFFWWHFLETDETLKPSVVHSIKVSL